MNEEIKILIETAQRLDFYPDGMESYKEGDYVTYEDFSRIVNELTKWNDIKEVKPEFCEYPIKQSNGNTLIFYNEYLLKGYYNNNPENTGIEYGAYMPGSVTYYFSTPNNFTITHWKKTFCENKYELKNINK